MTKLPIDESHGAADAKRPNPFTRMFSMFKRGHPSSRPKDSVEHVFGNQDQHGPAAYTGPRTVAQVTTTNHRAASLVPSPSIAPTPIPQALDVVPASSTAPFVVPLASSQPILIGVPTVLESTSTSRTNPQQRPEPIGNSTVSAVPIATGVVNDASTNVDQHVIQSPYKNIPIDLIIGTAPAIERAHGGIKYRPLVKTPEEQYLNTADVIRVLKVHPGGSNDPIECSLNIRLLYRLDSRGYARDIKISGIQEKDLPLHAYTALSYAWDAQTPSETIRIRYQESSKSSHELLEYRVTKNLYEALKGLRKPSGEGQYFWADAICMDQNNNEEKSQQLPLMSRIYSEAQDVCVWLGNGTAETASAFKLMEEIRKWRQYSDVVEVHTCCQQWVAFVDLISGSWFKRRWVVQEIVLASKAQLRCGFQSIAWTEFAQAVAFFEDMESRVKKKFREDKDFDNRADKFGNFKEYSACWLVKTTSDVVSRDDTGRVEKKTESLETLISLLTPFETGDPKDIVYSILSLAKDIRLTAASVNLDARIDDIEFEKILRAKDISDDGEKRRLRGTFARIARRFALDRFPVDYNKRLDEICEDLYKFTTTQSRSLDLICRPWCMVKDSVGLPTWVRSVEHRPYELNEGEAKRRHADTLVGLPGHSPYAASGSGRHDWDFERDGSPPGTLILSADGFQLDTISVIEDAAHAGSIPDSWFDPTYTKGDNDRISEPFWRTMVAGKGPDGKNPPLSYSLFCQELFQTSHAINLIEEKNKSSNQILIEFIDRVLSVVYGRKLARTDRHKRLALLPRQARSGDYICILYGCSVPVILRRTGERTEGVINNGVVEKEGRELWEFIGECYMHGMMFGDALIARREGALVDPEFYDGRRKFVIR